MKNALRLLMVLTLLLCNSCDQSNSHLFDLILEIKSQNDQLLNEVKTLQIKSDLLISELRASAAKQEDLLAKVNDLQSQMSSLLTQIATLNKQLENQNADVQLIKNKLSELETQYQGIFKQLEELQKLSQILAEIEKMKTQISQLDTRYTTILSGLVQNKQQLDALKTQITSVQTQLAENLTKIAQLTSKLGDQGVVIGNILKQIDLLKANNAELIKLMESLLIGKSPVPTNGLVGWWPFNGNANDESGNGFKGTLVGAILAKDRNGYSGKAYEFSSNVKSNIKLDISSKYPTGLSNKFSLMMWVKPTRQVNIVTESSACNGTVTVPMAYSNQNWAIVPPWGGKTSLGVGFSFGTNGLFIANHAENILVSRASISGQFTNFHCVILAQDGNDLYVYLDGSLVKKVTNSCPNSPKIITESFDLGGSLYSTSFSGVIDEFALWNRVISADEALKIYNGERF